MTLRATATPLRLDADIDWLLVVVGPSSHNHLRHARQSGICSAEAFLILTRPVGPVMVVLELNGGVGVDYAVATAGIACRVSRRNRSSDRAIASPADGICRIAKTRVGDAAEIRKRGHCDAMAQVFV